MSIKEFAQLIGKSQQFVRIACQQGQIECICNEGKTGRHSYEIPESEAQKWRKQ